MSLSCLCTSIYVFPKDQPLAKRILARFLETNQVIQGTNQKYRHADILLFFFFIQLSLFIAALDQTIVATAAPTISSQLDSASGYTWIGSAYLLANAAAVPILAKLSDIWGRKIILLFAVSLFGGSSIICAMASSMKMLIIGRALQGTASGGLIQMVNITISDLFSMR